MNAYRLAERLAAAVVPRRTWRATFVIAALLAGCNRPASYAPANPANATAPPEWVFGTSLRRYSDEDLVARAEQIVVGRLARESIAVEGGHYRAVLLVSRVLKGKVDRGPLPIEIHGLAPVIRGRYRFRPDSPETQSYEEPMRNRFKHPNEAVVLIDPGALSKTMQDFNNIGDASQENLWFFRRQGPKPEQRSERPAVWQWEDKQPLLFESYFAAYLSPDPAAALEALIRARPEFKARAQDYLGKHPSSP